MRADDTHRPPAPVLAAIVLLMAFAVVNSVVGAVVLFTSWAWILFLALAILPVTLMHGLWCGYRAARLVAIGYGVAMVGHVLWPIGGLIGQAIAALGLALVVLAWAPRSAREWCAGQRRSRAG